MTRLQSATVQHSCLRAEAIRLPRLANLQIHLPDLTTRPAFQIYVTKNNENGHHDGSGMPEKRVEVRESDGLYGTSQRLSTSMQTLVAIPVDLFETRFPAAKRRCRKAKERLLYFIIICSRFSRSSHTCQQVSSSCCLGNNQVVVLHQKEPHEPLVFASCDRSIPSVSE